MSRFLISCGGTGGHLSPGIALAEGLAARGHGTRLLISRKKVDGRLSEKYPHLHFERMPGTGFGWQPLTLLRCVWSQAGAFLFCLRLLRRERPDGIVAFGGFTAVPLVVAGWLLGVPAALHESNRVPGRAIRLLGRTAARVYLPPGLQAPGIPTAVIRHVGLPVRSEIARRPAAAARSALALSPHHRVLVILGGSQGASALNDWARSQLEFMAATGIQVYCVTGLGKGAEGRLELRTKSGEPITAVFTGFSDRMAEVLSAADLVISRAGAGTLAELMRCETPAILVPYPQAADDHQTANASWFESQGGGVLVPQPRLDDLRRNVLDVIFNDWLLGRFRGHLRQMDRAHALELMLDDLAELTGEHGAGKRNGEPLTA